MKNRQRLDQTPFDATVIGFAVAVTGAPLSGFKLNHSQTIWSHSITDVQHFNAYNLTFGVKVKDYTRIHFLGFHYIRFIKPDV